MDWIKEAKQLFSSDKPEHFTDYKHCEECLEHDETLLKGSIDTIGLQELGNPGWDPICFSNAEGIKYYMPAFIRLSLETMKDDFYLAQFLFHLEYDGTNNKLLMACSTEQRDFIARFLEHLILNNTSELEYHHSEDDALRVCELWSNA